MTKNIGVVLDPWIMAFMSPEEAGRAQGRVRALFGRLLAVPLDEVPEPAVPPETLLPDDPDQVHNNSEGFHGPSASLPDLGRRADIARAQAAGNHGRKFREHAEAEGDGDGDPTDRPKRQERCRRP
jgi:hypothetical protein